MSSPVLEKLNYDRYGGSADQIYDYQVYVIPMLLEDIVCNDNISDDDVKRYLSCRDKTVCVYKQEEE